MKKVLHITKWKRKSYIKHPRQANDLRADFEVAKWRIFVIRGSYKLALPASRKFYLIEPLSGLTSSLVWMWYNMRTSIEAGGYIHCFKRLDRWLQPVTIKVTQISLCKKGGAYTWQKLINKTLKTAELQLIFMKVASYPQRNKKITNYPKTVLATTETSCIITLYKQVRASKTQNALKSKFI